MKNLMKLVMVTVAVLLISGSAYAKKDNDLKKAGKTQNQMSDAASKQGQDASKEAKEEKSKAEEKAKKGKKEVEGKSKDVKDANSAAEKKQSESKNLFGFAWGKDHQQQLKALDEKTARTDASDKSKIAALEKELSGAQAANDAKKAEKLEKKLVQAKQKSADEMKKIEAKRAKIQTDMAKEE